MKWYLDFGHGGKDPGAIGTNNTKESDVLLKVGMLVKSTRDSDLFYSLDYRTKKANKEGCDYFVSIHMNTSTNKATKGCEV